MIEVSYSQEQLLAFYERQVTEITCVCAQPCHKYRDHSTTSTSAFDWMPTGSSVVCFWL